MVSALRGQTRPAGLWETWRCSSKGCRVWRAVRVWTRSCALSRCPIRGAERSGVGTRHPREQGMERSLELCVRACPSQCCLHLGAFLDTAGRRSLPPAPHVRPVTCRCQHRDIDAPGVVPAHHPGSMVAMKVLAPGSVLATVASVWSRERFSLGLQGPEVGLLSGVCLNLWVQC